MSTHMSELDSSSNGEDGDDRPESVEPMSKTTLVIAIVVMLLPAGIPLYFALRLGGSAAIWLVALALTLAFVNTALVFAVWNWVHTLRADS